MADQTLNGLSRKIGKATDDITAAEASKKNAWEKVLEIGAEFAREGGDLRFVANDGYTLAPTTRSGSPRLDEKRLKKLIDANLPRAAAIWKSITEPHVNTTLLEQAIQSGKIPATLVDECLTVPEPTLVRNRVKWTKEDNQKAEIFGIVKTEDGNG